MVCSITKQTTRYLLLENFKWNNSSLYIDDILLTNGDEQDILKVKKQLENKFALKDFSKPSLELCLPIKLIAYFLLKESM